MTFDEFYQATFIGTIEYCGLKRNKLYTIKAIENRPYGLMLQILDEEDEDIICPYCNLKSVERVWKIIK